jgi:hypothetical protein
VGAQARGSVACPGRDKSPGEHPALAASTRQKEGTPGRVKAQESGLAGPACGFARRSNGRRNGMWVHPGRKRRGYLSGGERFGGRESQERCRHATEPARARGE